MGKQVVVLGPDDDRSAQAVQRYRELATAAGNDVDIKFVSSDLEIGEIAAEAAEAIAIIPAGGSALTIALIEKLPNLRLIQTTSAGTDRMDKAAIYELGVKVANNGGQNRVAVSEHAIALMIAVYRKLDHQIRSAREGKWASDIPGEINEFHTLENKTVAIVGFGRIGQAVAKRLQGWDCEIVYYDVVDVPAEIARELNASRLPIDELLLAADVVTLHVALERTTRHMIAARELAQMKNTSILINTCRGPVVDEAALISALRDGEIAGAGLDVLEQEPTPPDNPLLSMDNVIVTPHTASRAVESRLASTEFAIANVGRLARGEAPTSLVPPV